MSSTTKPTTKPTTKEWAEIRRAIKAAAGGTAHCPIHVVMGSEMPPTLVGERGGHFTKGGTLVDHPTAYSKKGWSNMEYRRSTMRVMVGGAWLAAHFDNNLLTSVSPMAWQKVSRHENIYVLPTHN